MKLPLFEKLILNEIMWIVRPRHYEKNKYVRFVAVRKLQYRKWHPLSLTGVLTMTNYLKKRKITANEKQKINDILDWFNDSIPCPFVFNSYSNECICWWKIGEHSKSAIQKAKKLFPIFRKYGYAILTIYTDQLSNIKYTDKYQVIAECPLWIE